MPSSIVMTWSQQAGRRRQRANGTAASLGVHPTICGASTTRRIKLGDTRYCYPLTVTDHASRFLLLCEAKDPFKEELALRLSSGCFANGACQRPFVLTMAFLRQSQWLVQLSKLAVWWLRLGIEIERIQARPSPENGRHEAHAPHPQSRSHQTTGMNFLQQQARF